MNINKTTGEIFGWYMSLSFILTIFLLSDHFSNTLMGHSRIYMISENEWIFQRSFKLHEEEDEIEYIILKKYHVKTNFALCL